MATNNLDRPALAFEKRFLRVLPSVFARRKFGRAFMDLQVLDGIAENKTAMTVKTNDMAVIVNEYNQTAIVDAKDSNNRFGKLQEVIYTNTDVEYDVPLSTNILIDITTVNNDLDVAVAEQLIRAAEKYTVDMNVADGEFFSDNAGITKTIADFSDEETELVLNELAAEYINLEVAVDVTMYVRPDLYGALVDSRLASTGKKL